MIVASGSPCVVSDFKIANASIGSPPLICWMARTFAITGSRSFQPDSRLKLMVAMPDALRCLRQNNNNAAFTSSGTHEKNPWAMMKSNGPSVGSKSLRSPATNATFAIPACAARSQASLIERSARSMPTHRLSGHLRASGNRLCPEQQPISKIRARRGCGTSSPPILAATAETAGSDKG